MKVNKDKVKLDKIKSTRMEERKKKKKFLL